MGSPRAQTSIAVFECSLCHFCGAARFGAVGALAGAAHTILSAMCLHFKPDSSLWCETWNRSSAQSRACPLPCHTHQCLPVTSCSNKPHSLARAQGCGWVSAPSSWQEQSPLDNCSFVLALELRGTVWLLGAEHRTKPSCSPSPWARLACSSHLAPGCLCCCCLFLSMQGRIKTLGT